MSWTVADILARLRATDEDSRVEAKRGSTPAGGRSGGQSWGKSALETVSAFANEPGLGGGWLIFGVVRDSDGVYQLLGVTDPDGLQNDLSVACRNELNRPVRPEIRVESIEGVRLVAAFIPESPAADKPIYRKGAGLPRGAFRRIGSADQHFTDEDLSWIVSLGSRSPLDRQALPGALLTDIDAEALEAWRRRLAEVRPTSDLLGFSDTDLLQAIGAAIPSSEGLQPTLGGVLLLGGRIGLRRLLPAMRLDYIRLRGPGWTVENDDSYTVLEVREGLVTGWRRAFSAILDDMPRTWTFPAGTPYRHEIPRLPERAIREALLNAVMHRDYNLHGSIQIRRFSNRLEIENPGHSLVSEDEWGQLFPPSPPPLPKRGGEPVSRTRNPMLADAFRNLVLAEAKGTGIRKMRELMHESKLSMPIFESSREGGWFRVTFLFHHLLDEADIAWLPKGEALDDTDIQVLVWTRDNGHITNAEVRAFSGDDTLVASQRLRRLVDRGLLVAQGEARRERFYELESGLKARATQPANLDAQPTNLVGKGTNLDAIPTNLSPEGTNLGPEGTNLGPEGTNLGPEGTNLGPEGTNLSQKTPLPPDLEARIQVMRAKAGPEEIEDLILQLCRIRFWEPVELGLRIGRNPSYLKRKFLLRMTEEGKLVRKYPGNPHHPRQAYRAAGGEPGEKP